MQLSPADDERFTASLATAERSRALVAGAVAAPLYLLFGVLDWVMWPEQFPTLAAIRGSAAAGMVVVFLSCLRARRYWPIVFHETAYFVLATSGVTAMCHLTGGHASPYYAGIGVCVVFLAALVTWPLWFASLVIGLQLVSYYLPIAFEPAVSWRRLAMHSFFLLSTVAVALLGIRLRMTLARQEFLSRTRLADANEELQRVQRLKDRMFQNVSHELRTPLTLVLAPLPDMLEDPTLPPRHARGLQAIRRNGLRLLRLINDLLDLVKLDNARLPADRVPVDVAALLARVMEDVRETGAARDLDVSLRLPPSHVVYELDPDHLERIVLNLLSNALKFTDAGGRVVVSLEDADDGMTLSVEDTGEGVPPEAQELIFRRFEQVDGGSTRRHGGTGIGLALVRELTELMGGSVGVESPPGKGARFTVRFPAGRRSVRLPGPAAPPPPDRLADLRRQAAYVSLDPGPAGTVVEAGRHGPRLLVAEDDPALRAHLVELLGVSHRVTAVANGEEALRRAVERVPDLVLTDVMMPGMDGLQLCAALRERTALKDTPIVVLSARGELDDRIRGRQIGADSYLTKPFDPRELLATVEGLLRSRMRLVGSFLVRDPLGRGGQAQVFLAEHVATGEPVALKLISLAGLTDAAARERLRREHQALRRIRHPNVVRVVEEGEAEPGFYIAMEYLAGASFEQIVDANGPLRPGHVGELARGLCAGLAAVHEAGLLHRDIKCSNCMVLRGEGPLERRVRLIDFGTVHPTRAASDGGVGLIGTPAYAAPEVLIGQPPSVASDIYAAGVAMFRLATGRLPYGKGDTHQLLRRMIESPPPSVRSLAPRAPEVLERAVFNALAFDPRQRPSSAAELAGSLAALEPDPEPLELPEDGRQGTPVGRLTPTV